MKAKVNDGLNIVFILTLGIILMAMLSGCKRTEYITQTRTVIDSTAVIEKDSIIDHWRQSTHRERSERTTFMKQAAIMMNEILSERDSSLPVKQFKRVIGEGFIDLKYQGQILNYSYYMPEQQDIRTEISDSSSMVITELKAENRRKDVRISHLESALKDRLEIKEVGFWKKLWAALKFAWWVGLVCFVLGIFARSRLPF